MVEMGSVAEGMAFWSEVHSAAQRGDVERLEVLVYELGFDPDAHDSVRDPVAG